MVQRKLKEFEEKISAVVIQMLFEKFQCVDGKEWDQEIRQYLKPFVP